MLILTKLKLRFSITDSGTGEQATHLFSIGNGTLSGSLSSTNRGWLLPSEMSGAVEWLIIPLSEAAPESDKSYDVGGILRYSLDGENITIPLLPTVISVRPDPSLLVHYFWERYVVGDDPFTDEIEPFCTIHSRCCCKKCWSWNCLHSTDNIRTASNY